MDTRRLKAARLYYDDYRCAICGSMSGVRAVDGGWYFVSLCRNCWQPGIPVPRPIRKPQEEHAKKLEELWRMGYTYVELGRILGVTKQRVHQIVQRYRARSGEPEKQRGVIEELLRLQGVDERLMDEAIRFAMKLRAAFPWKSERTIAKWAARWATSQFSDSET